MSETDPADPDITVERDGDAALITMMADRRLNAQRRTAARH